LSLSTPGVSPTFSVPVTATTLPKPRFWMPDRVMFTPAALDELWGQQILSRVQALNLPVEELPRNRLAGLRGESDRETYDISNPHSALSTVTADNFEPLNGGIQQSK
jgi:spore photoproduct lyase